MSTASSAALSSNPSLDLDAFHADIEALRREIRHDVGEADLAHVRKIERWGKIASAIGFATAWIAPNPLSAAALSLGRSTRWLMMHHVGHRGYDRVPGVAPRHTSRIFGRGWRRWIDWADWMTPEAWCHEHNTLHHASTGELSDPDLLEHNVEWVHRLPRPVRWMLLTLLATTWRFSYYATNTMEHWLSRRGGTPTWWQTRRQLVVRCWIPYVALQFVLVPALFLPLGRWAVFSVLANSLLAEILTNLHTFLVVGPNHSGSDLYRFDDRPRDDGEYYFRQIVGSTNYATGGDLLDYSHLWLNYQIEHHLFPDVPMLQYRKVQGRVRAICERHGIPYVQESLWTRVAKMTRVFLGDEEMRRDARAEFSLP
jgi:fatty acid desaturase